MADHCVRLFSGKMRLSAKHPITMMDDIAVRVGSQTDFSAQNTKKIKVILTDMPTSVVKL